MAHPDWEKDYILAHWWDAIPNWGDALNPVLIHAISKRRPLMATGIAHPSTWPVYSVIGSVLGGPTAQNLHVWGSGFKSENSTLPVQPAKVYAVRGPLTRQKLLDLGITAPAVYGDPALLYPRYYNPPAKKDKALGIIPHFKDQSTPLLNQFRGHPEIEIIDILGEVNQVVDQIVRCHHIASSSLHGLIAADAYGVASTWVEFEGDIGGGGFKFSDYFISVGRPTRRPLQVRSGTDLDEIVEAGWSGMIDIDLEQLYHACPFRDDAQSHG